MSFLDKNKKEMINYFAQIRGKVSFRGSAQEDAR